MMLYVVVVVLIAIGALTTHAAKKTKILYRRGSWIVLRNESGDST